MSNMIDLTKIDSYKLLAEVERIYGIYVSTLDINNGIAYDTTGKAYRISGIMLDILYEQNNNREV